MKSRSLLIGELRGLGFTVYRIAKEVGASWNTVHYWDTGAFRPNEENTRKLEDLIERVRDEKRQSNSRL